MKTQKESKGLALLFL